MRVGITLVFCVSVSAVPSTLSNTCLGLRTHLRVDCLFIAVKRESRKLCTPTQSILVLDFFFLDTGSEAGMMNELA